MHFSSRGGVRPLVEWVAAVSGNKYPVGAAEALTERMPGGKSTGVYRRLAEILYFLHFSPIRLPTRCRRDIWT